MADRPSPESLAIVLPAYNEKDRLGDSLDELFAYLRSADRAALPPAIDVLVVDDGSTDATADLVRARPEARTPGAGGDGVTLRVLSVPHGGKGSAVRAGMLAATADIIVFSDADMATPPDQIPRLLAALSAHDIALGSRIQPDGSDMRATQPRYRRFVGRAFHVLAAIWVTGPVRDTQCGFKGFDRAVAHDLFARQRITSIVFDVEIIHLARKRHYRAAIVPIRWLDKRGSRMRTGPGLALRVAWDLFRIPIIHRRVKSNAKDRS
jgi:dolichyl-phosphate beta-glucosyltransferase